MLSEGGLKLPPEKRVELTPQLVKDACKLYENFINDWNSWLGGEGFEPVIPIGPSGSSTYAELDAVEKPDTTYGDVDYLVSFPVNYDSDDTNHQRKSDATARRDYSNLLTRFLQTQSPKNVNVPLTLKGNSLQIVVDVNGTLVQVDTTITHPNYSNWMKGRYVPERGIKGYVTGRLYKALGDFLDIVIGIEGVLVRTKNGVRVKGNVRTGVSISNISTNFNTFLLDIAYYLLGENCIIDKQLRQFPGLKHDSVSINDLANGIVGLANTLDLNHAYDKHQMLSAILLNFKEGLGEAVDRKISKDLTIEKQTKLLKLNDEQYKRVKNVFNI
jgi:hypothetical protein